MPIFGPGFRLGHASRLPGRASRGMAGRTPSDVCSPVRSCPVAARDGPGTATALPRRLQVHLNGSAEPPHGSQACPDGRHRRLMLPLAICSKGQRCRRMGSMLDVESGSNPRPSSPATATSAASQGPAARRPRRSPVPTALRRRWRPAPDRRWRPCHRPARRPAPVVVPTDGGRHRGPPGRALWAGRPRSAPRRPRQSHRHQQVQVEAGGVRVQPDGSAASATVTGWPRAEHLEQLDAALSRERGASPAGSVMA